MHDRRRAGGIGTGSGIGSLRLASALVFTCWGWLLGCQGKVAGGQSPADGPLPAGLDGNRGGMGTGGIGAAGGAGGATSSGGVDASSGAGGSAFVDGGATDGSTQTAFVLPYYRIRIEYIDNSDWTTLAFNDAAKVIKTRVMSLTGSAMASGATKQGLSLNANQANSGLTMTADVAVTPEATAAPFSLTLGKGAAGTVTIRVLTVVGGQVTLIKEIPNQAAQPMTFTVDLSSLKNFNPELAPMAPVKNMGVALYYPWYDLGSWSNPVLTDKPATPYASNNPTDLARQIDQAQSAGINAFSVSWIGPGSPSDNNVKLLLAEAQKKGFFIGFFLETTIGNLGQDTAKAIDWLSYIANQYGDHPAALKVDGRPVVTPWVTGTIPVATWATIRAGVRARGKDVWLMQDVQGMDYLDVFDGVQYSGGIAGLGEMVRYHAVLADKPAPKLWMASAMPGFDERKLSDRGPNPRFIDRMNGDYFRGQLTDAFNNTPQWVLVYTWNEWYENTYVEPSANYGTQYLQLVSQYLLGWAQR